MPDWSPDSHLAVEQPADAAALLADLLRAHGFLDSEMPALFGAADAGDLASNAALYSLSGIEGVEQLYESSAGALAQLFIRNSRLPVHVYNGRLSARLRDLLESFKLIKFNSQQVSGNVSITPYMSMMFLSDQLFRCHDHEGGGRLLVMSESDAFVMPPHVSSFLLLANIARHGGHLLDVGCGSGVIALVHAEHCETVEGIDLNPRAVAYATFNNRLNGLDAKFRVARFPDDLDPAGRYDHLVFNDDYESPHKKRVGVTGTWRAARMVADLIQLGLSPLRSGGLAQALVVVNVPSAYSSASDLIADWMSSRSPGMGQYWVTEFPASRLSMTAAAIARGSAQPGCALVDNFQDARLLIRRLHELDIREVVAAIISMTA